MSETVNDLNGNAPITIQLLNAIRAFVRDVGTPITVLLFIGMIYTGYLHSPLTDIVDESRTILVQHGIMLRGIDEERNAMWAIYGLVRSECRADPNMKDKLDQCDKMTTRAPKHGEDEEEAQ